jgi:putative phage-type endonuclease
MKKHKIEQKTDAWFQIRKGKITGTTLKAIMGTPKARQEAIYELIAERLTVGVDNPDVNYENAMERGCRLEPDARIMFEFETGLKVEEVGFCENDDNSSIGYSPDGIISDAEDIEIKCMGGKNHIKMWITNKIPEEYSWQVVQAFVVNPKLKKRYFVGYNPDIPTHPLHIIEITREEIEKEIKEAEENQIKFLKDVEVELNKIIKI